MMVRRFSALRWMTRPISACPALSGVSIRIPDMPMMPFIGVRSSWLMLARNSDFSREASSAWSRTCSR